jgi:hypothetical protein
MTEQERRPGEPEQNQGRTWEELHSFEPVASDLGIPEERWTEPAVRYFIEVNRQVKILKSTLEHRIYPVEGSTHSGPQGTPSLDQRYSALTKIARVAEIFLEDGSYASPVAQSETDRKYVGQLLTQALTRLNYDMKVVDTRVGQAPVETHLRDNPSVAADASLLPPSSTEDQT